MRVTGRGAPCSPPLLLMADGWTVYRRGKRREGGRDELERYGERGGWTVAGCNEV